jgi:hypothetical protein
MTSTETLVSALRSLAMIAADNHSANAALAEAADRLEEMQCVLCDIHNNALPLDGCHIITSLEAYMKAVVLISKGKT